MTDSASRPAAGFRCGLLFWAFILLVPMPALAWNGAGHRLVACIAWENLDDRARLAVSLLLREHPDYARWQKRATGDNGDRIAFIEASTWSDDIRKDSRFYSAGIDEPTPPQAGFPDMERHRDWHYVNRPLNESLRHERVSGQIGRQLVALAKTLAAADAPRPERVYALPWLIHLTGDAHQPLHTSIRLDAEGRWDRLGTGQSVINPFNPRKRSSTLHAFWDDLPGPPWLRGERLDAASRALIAAHPRASSSASSEQWIDESWRIAREHAYPTGSQTIPTVDEAFFMRSREIANQRIALAGYRLADLLNHVLGAR